MLAFKNPSENLSSILDISLLNTTLFYLSNIFCHSFIARLSLSAKRVIQTSVLIAAEGDKSYWSDIILAL